jgi:hypothetical protein
MDLITVSLKASRFERDLVMSTYDNQKTWMRFTGKSRFDAYGDLKGDRSVFTSIDKYVREK